MSGVATAIVAAAAIGGGTSAYQGSQTRKMMAGQKSGYDVVTMPQYSFTEPRMQLTSDYVSGGLRNLMEGKYPSYYEKAMPKLRAGMQQEAYKTYFGRPGERTGQVQRAMETGAITGMGAGATQAQVGKAYKDYSERSNQIDDYLTKMGVGIMQQESQMLPQFAMNIPQGPQASVVSYGGGASAPSGGAPGMDLSGIPWENMFSSGGQNPNANMNYMTPNTGTAGGYNVGYTDPGYMQGQYNAPPGGYSSQSPYVSSAPFDPSYAAYR